MEPKLLIIDDNPEICSALIRGLALNGYDAVAEYRADTGLQRLTSEPFAGAIVDVMLTDESGIDLVRAARGAGFENPILMLSALSGVEHRTAGLEAGANDYVVKPFSFDELVARLRVQENRIKAQRAEIAILSRTDRTLKSTEYSVVFTEREYELLDLLIEKAGQPVSRTEIFDTLWLKDGSSNENVVDVYLGYLRKKLKTGAFRFEITTLRNEGFCVNGQLPKRTDALIADQSLMDS